MNTTPMMSPHLAPLPRLFLEAREKKITTTTTTTTTATTPTPTTTTTTPTTTLGPVLPALDFREGQLEITLQRLSNAAGTMKTELSEVKVSVDGFNTAVKQFQASTEEERLLVSNNTGALQRLSATFNRTSFNGNFGALVNRASVANATGRTVAEGLGIHLSGSDKDNATTAERIDAFNLNFEASAAQVRSSLKKLKASEDGLAENSTALAFRLARSYVSSEIARQQANTTTELGEVMASLTSEA